MLQSLGHGRSDRIGVNGHQRNILATRLGAAALPWVPGTCLVGTRVRLPAGLLTVSALSREDVWAIGPTVNTTVRGLGDFGGTLPASEGVDGHSRAVGRWLWDGRSPDVNKPAGAW
jgi:hypothetical protein